MPRLARTKSRSGIYHLMLRGANRQDIFHEDEDNQRFLDILFKYSKSSGAKVYGWCLMSNHLHLLLGEGFEDLSVTMKRIGVSFAWYYNWKYKTTGHLFQDRFKSENVESDQYLLTVIRYIHQNPVKAGMVKKVEQWKWSSYNQYLGMSHRKGMLESELILSMFSIEDTVEAIRKFKEFNEAGNDDQCLDNELRTRLTDEEAINAIIKHTNGIDVIKVRNLAKVERDKIFRRVKRIEGVALRQAARIFGVSTSLLFRA